ncbi:uncharacterized protein PHALS_07252 [Plasmopara halstedii]|uniref:Uncharacterized protein n=1 Tax=Plasmopara halstedii TaxID=4781 RepID=A0A0P1B625_PLAHL|nr:uncharacterized protein PHALS_07252 [Plasmopara halstedii]CEG49489.1 hypothetical protein PHALS_07252 [Plasmopara halstedii]|eukprot:XP_024585858.1 hypothetical protein PHALS_07252 [Plasmopara halstedii]
MSAASAPRYKYFVHMPLASKAVSIALDVSHNFLYTNVGMGAKEEDLLSAQLAMDLS